MDTHRDIFLTSHGACGFRSSGPKVALATQLSVPLQGEDRTAGMAVSLTQLTYMFPLPGWVLDSGYVVNWTDSPHLHLGGY